jgi:SSS family solute:Na+ symporter
VIWIAVSLYALAAIYLGWWANSQTEDGASFWTAGRSLGTASVGLSISAGFMSVSWSCVYAVQLFYWYGLAALWLITVPWLLALIGIYFLTSKYHALPAFSQPEMIAVRFGIGSKRIVALALSFVFLVWGGAEIYVAANLLAPALDISVFWTVTGICFVVGVYTTLGGFRAVVSTDKLQYVIVAFYILTMGWLALNGLWETKQRLLPTLETATFKSARPWNDLAGPGILTIVIGLIAYLPGWLFETDLWLRVQAAKTSRQARRGMLIAAGNALLFVGLLPLLIGVTALALFPPVDGLAPAIIGNQGDTIFVALVQSYAPVWLAMLAAVGLVAAAMSTIDTCINVMALSIAYDLFALHEKTDGKQLSRYITILAVAAAGIFALNT